MGRVSSEFNSTKTSAVSRFGQEFFLCPRLILQKPVGWIRIFAELSQTSSEVRRCTTFYPQKIEQPAHYHTWVCVCTQWPPSFRFYTTVALLVT